MQEVIIYKNDEGGVSVIYPAPDCGLTVEEIAVKDVPTGRPFGIVMAQDLPPRESRAGWEIDESLLTDGVGE